MPKTRTARSVIINDARLDLAPLQGSTIAKKNKSFVGHLQRLRGLAWLESRGSDRPLHCTVPYRTSQSTAYSYTHRQAGMRDTHSSGWMTFEIDPRSASASPCVERIQKHSARACGLLMTWTKQDQEVAVAVALHRVRGYLYCLLCFSLQELIRR